MDLSESVEVADYRKQVRTFLEEHLPEDWRGIGALGPDELDAFRVGWRAKLEKERLLAPAWPREYGGGGLDVLAQAVVAEEFTRAGVPQAPAPCDNNGFILLGPTLLHWGTDAQKEYFLPRTVSGEITWAQGYSEAEAGSDLFGLRTRAELVGDEWVVNGHKMWQTAGSHANWIFVLARTDPAAERAKGLSLIMLPLDQSGVDVRGIANMAGETEFAEVFFDGARASADHVIGPVGDGARVALSLLGFERGAGGMAATASYEIELERLRRLMTDTGRDDVADFVERWARCRTTVHVLRCLAMRTLAAGARGGTPGAESSVFKLVTAEYRQAVTELAVDVLGSAVVTAPPSGAIALLGPQPLGTDHLDAAVWVADLVHARPVTIYGGSSEIQRNTIAEQLLGLPREPRPVAQERSQA